MENFFKNYFNEIFQKFNNIYHVLIKKFEKKIIKINSNKNKIVIFVNND